MIVCAVLAAYANTFAVPFLLDDIGAIAENPSIRRLWPLDEVLSPPAKAGVGGRPVANLSFALNHAIGGRDVRGYHVVNLAIHMAAALVLFGLVRRTLTLPRVRERFPADDVTVTSIALGAALLWALHPLQTEAVTYLSQRTESLMSLFYLATLYSLVRATQAPGSRWALLGVACCALGMGTKEVMVTAPVLALLYDRTFVTGSFREAWQERRRLYLALAATWLLLALLLIDVRERGVGHASVAWWEYGLTSIRAIVHYLRLALWPAPLVFDYGTTVVRHAGEIWAHLVVFAVLVAATLAALWRRPMLGFGGAWILVILAPASSIVPVAGQTMAEHRMFLPLAAVAVGVVLAVHRWLRGGAVYATGFLAMLLGVATFARNRDYQDAVTIWSDTARKCPQNARAHASLGAALLARGERAPAMAALERALQIDPRRAEAQNNLAHALLDAGRPAEAIARFTAALELQPGVASTHYNLGQALLGLGRAAEAIPRQQQALRLQPEFPEANCALADALLAAGRGAEAIGQYREALRRRPELTPAHFGLANALSQSGQLAAAIGHYEAVLRAVPASVEARYNLAMALAQTGRIQESITQFEWVLQQRPDLETARLNLEALRRAPRR